VSDAPSFAQDIKPFFRDEDRDAMEWAFDLHDHGSVSENAAAILERLEDGSMPCDGEWPAEQVERFRAWIAAGAPA
jgi:hypothetical protein